MNKYLLSSLLLGLTITKGYALIGDGQQQIPTRSIAQTGNSVNNTIVPTILDYLKQYYGYASISNATYTDSHNDIGSKDAWLAYTDTKGYYDYVWYGPGPGATKFTIWGGEGSGVEWRTYNISYSYRYNSDEAFRSTSTSYVVFKFYKSSCEDFYKSLPDQYRGDAAKGDANIYALAAGWENWRNWHLIIDKDDNICGNPNLDKVNA